MTDEADLSTEQSGARARHGFRSRMATPGGRNVIRARRNRGRKKLSA